MHSEVQVENFRVAGASSPLLPISPSPPCSVFVDQLTQAPLSMEFSRQEYCNGLPFIPLGDLPNPGFKPSFPVSPALEGRFFTVEPPGKSPIITVRA